MKELKINDLLFHYPEKNQEIILNQMNLSIKEQEFVSIIGRSGCGKSTFLKLIAGLYHPISGKIKWNGKTINNPSPERILMFQNPCLLPWLNVKENILFGCSIRKENKIDEAYHLIKTMELEKFLGLYPSDLSSGIAQRTALARALLSEPEILLLDESFSSLDILSQSVLVQFTYHHWKSKKLTVLLVSHDIDEALKLSTRVIIMSTNQGNIQADMKIPLEYPRESYNQQFIEYKQLITNEVFINEKT